MKSKYKNLLKNKLFWLIVISILARLVFASVYTPKAFPETNNYLRLARQFTSGDFTGYLGKNAPIYSFMIIACGFNLKVLAAFQQLLGLGIAVLLFLIFSRLSASDWIGLLAGLSYALNPSQLLFESAFLPETTCTFLVTLIAFLFLNMVKKDRKPPWWRYAFLGFLSGVCLLTRPHYQFLPPLLLIFFIYDLRRKATPWLVKSISLVFPVIILLGVWLGFQYARVGRASTTTHLGVTLMYHPFNFIEYAPDRFSNVREVLLKVRGDYMRRKGDTYGAVEYAIPELMEKTGLSYAELDRLYLSMAVATIMEKPGLYGANLVRALARFFKPSWYSRQFGIRGVMAGKRMISKVIAAGYTAVHLALVTIFVLFPLLMVLFKKFRVREFVSIEVLFIYVSVWTAAAVQAVLVLGENNRFRVSVEPLLFAAAVWIAIKLINRFRGLEGSNNRSAC